MTIIQIDPNENGSHNNKTVSTPAGIFVPEGYALVPPDLGTPEMLENFPFGDITVDTSGSYPVVTSWTPLPVPESNPERLAEEV